MRKILKRIHSLGSLAALVAGLALTAAPAPPAHAGSSSSARSAFDEGNRLYKEERYSEALAAYRSVLASGFGSPELYLNLGDAAYKSGEPGWAIYYFTLAQQGAPRDPDIKTNLSLVRREALGEEPSIRRSSLLDAAASLRDLIPMAGAARAAAVLFWIASGALAASWVGRLRRRAQPLRWAALACAVAALVLVSVKWAEASLAYDAVTVEQTAAHAEPSEEATVEFRLPTGSPVNLGRETPEWREVIVSSSLRGWVSSSCVASFDRPR